jgi:DNA-binding YbaB/EbfC family protein
MRWNLDVSFRVRAPRNTLNCTPLPEKSRAGTRKKVGVKLAPPFLEGKIMLPNIPGLQKQIQKMQEDMARAQDELENARLETSSGGGMVKVATNGKGEVIDIQLAPEIVDPSDIEMLQDLIVSAMREAGDKAEQYKTEKMNAAMPPGLMGSLPKGIL